MHKSYLFPLVAFLAIVTSTSGSDEKQGKDVKIGGGPSEIAFPDNTGRPPRGGGGSPSTGIDPNLKDSPEPAREKQQDDSPINEPEPQFKDSPVDEPAEKIPGTPQFGYPSFVESDEEELDQDFFDDDDDDDDEDLDESDDDSPDTDYPPYDGLEPSSFEDNLDDDDDFDDDDGTLEDSVYPSNITDLAIDDEEGEQEETEGTNILERRGRKDFRFYRTHFYTRSCGIHGSNCVDGSIDMIKVHTDCKKACKSDHFFETDLDKNLCNKKFKVCGKTYRLKYTGKKYSCMRLKFFNRKGMNHGRTYANIVRNGEKVGHCKVDTKRNWAKSCSVFGATSFWGRLRCFLK